MICSVAVAAGFVALLRDVDFTADDRVHAFGLGGVVELDGAEEVTEVGHGDGGHFLFDDRIHELADFTGAVEEGVIGVAVQMDERVFRHGVVSLRSGEVLLFYDNGGGGEGCWLRGGA